MTRDHQLSLIYRHTHPDYRGHVNGERSILVLGKSGGTELVLLATLTEDEITEKLPYALRQEAKRNAARK